MRIRLEAELLDDDRGTPREIAASLDDLWRLNRHFGGLSGQRALLARLPEAPRLTLLDVGGGRGEMAQASVAMLRERGCDARAIVLDRRVGHLGNGPLRVAGDAFALPFADAGVDVVLCNLFLHHFHGDEALALLRGLYRVARVALVVNDLERAWLPYLFTRTLLPLFVGRITRYDAPRSVRQAYTAAELDQRARAAGFGRFDVLRLPTWRLGLIAWKDGDAGL